MANLKDTLSSPTDFGIQFQTNDTFRSFSSLNCNKAPGPDNISARVLKTCADQLAPVFTQLYNESSQTHIPSIWKTAKIIPVPKKSTPKEPNDYRPIALTSIPFKCCERIILNKLLDEVGSILDCHQYAYQKGRSVEDATLCYIDTITKHLESNNAYARSLFIDFSSAFNTIIPHILVHKLINLGVSNNLCRFILDFLTDRKQFVYINGQRSSTILLNIGSPQGCVLSAVLFILYTNGLIAKHDNCYIIKYADDTAIIGLISNNNEQDYFNEIASTVKWCNENNLLLNVSKTKELIFDFRKHQQTHNPLDIDGTHVDIVHSYKYLGTIIDDKLSWLENTDNIYSKCQQRLYFLRVLKSFGVNNTILNLFYSSVIQSVFSFNIVVWWSSMGKGNQRTINRIYKKACKTIKDTLCAPDTIYLNNTITQVHNIMSDSDHLF